MPADLASFTKFDSKNMRFIILPTDKSQIKSYSVTIVLIDFPDDIANQRKNTFTLII